MYGFAVTGEKSRPCWLTSSLSASRQIKGDLSVGASANATQAVISCYDWKNSSDHGYPIPVWGSVTRSSTARHRHPAWAVFRLSWQLVSHRSSSSSGPEDLERVSCSNLHDARMPLNLRKVRPIGRRAQSVQTGVQGDGEVSDAGQLLGIGYIEDVPSDLQLMVFVVRHLPGF